MQHCLTPTRTCGCPSYLSVSRRLQSVSRSSSTVWLLSCHYSSEALSRIHYKTCFISSPYMRFVLMVVEMTCCLFLRRTQTEQTVITCPLLCVPQRGNDFGEVFDETKHVQSQVLLVKLNVNEPDIDFSPSFQECWEVIQRAFLEIIKGAEKLPRVEYFPSSLCPCVQCNVFFVL